MVMSGDLSAVFDADQAEQATPGAALATVGESYETASIESYETASIESYETASMQGAPASTQGPAVGAPLAPPVEQVPSDALVAKQPRWRGFYQVAVVLADLAAAICAMVAAFGVRFGALVGNSEPVPLALLVAFPFAWIAVAGLSRAYEVRVLGAGAVEYERLGKAFLQLTALITFVAYASHADLSRGFVLLALPATLALSVGFRFGLRKIIHRRRRAGEAMIPVLAVGAADAIATFSDTLMRNAHNGLRVSAACVIGMERESDVVDPAAAGTPTELDERAIPVCGDVDTIREAVRQTGVSTVAVVDNRISGDKLRWISWQLEGTDTDLVVLPALTEVAGRRLSILQVGALPLLYVAEPEFRGLRRLIKSGVRPVARADRPRAASPRHARHRVCDPSTSRGPALFVQTRVGKDGKPFRMVKFRSMVDDAEDQLESLQAYNEVEGGTLFKIKSDPRVTRVGLPPSLSLDEVPQLLNVLAGSMSLVGPRPAAAVRGRALRG